MHMWILFILIGIVIFTVGFHVSSWYRCPVCHEWFWLGDGATLIDQPDGNLVLSHGKVAHKHTRGYHGLGSKPIN